MSLGPGGEDRMSRAGVTAIPFLGTDLPKRNENVNPHKKLSMNVCSSMTHKSQNVGRIPYVLTVVKGKFSIQSTQWNIAHLGKVLKLYGRGGLQGSPS